MNEFRLGYFRLDTTLNQPLGGKGTSLADLGFASGANGAPGIFPGTPSVEGVPEIDFNSFIIGVPSRPNHLIDNIYQVVDNFSKAIGTHNIKFGGQFHFRPAGRKSIQRRQRELLLWLRLQRPAQRNRKRLC